MGLKFLTKLHFVMENTCPLVVQLFMSVAVEVSYVTMYA